MEEGNLKRRLGWRPIGSRKAIEYSVAEVEGATWCREGNEKRLGSPKVSRNRREYMNYVLGLRDSPSTARKPANESSTG